MKATLKIQNLKCHGCANTITSKLSGLENISDVEVNNDDDTVSFSYITQTELKNAETLLSKIGYPVIGNDNSIATKAKSYVSCAIGRMK
jgi:copper chaperone